MLNNHSSHVPQRFVINFKTCFENLNRNRRNNHETSILNSKLIAKSYTSENRNMPFTVHEVSAAIKRFKNNKSAGIDCVFKVNAAYLKKIILSMKTIHYPNTIRSHLVTIVPIAPFTPKSTSKLRFALHIRYSIVIRRFISRDNTAQS